MLSMINLDNLRNIIVHLVFMTKINQQSHFKGNISVDKVVIDTIMNQCMLYGLILLHWQIIFFAGLTAKFNVNHMHNNDQSPN